MTSVQYKFTDLSDIRVGEIYNVIAVVKYFQNPEKTKGTGFKMTVSITDPSLGYDNKLTCNIFNDKPENLPRILSRGDVIIIHRLKIGSYKEKPQGTGTHKLGFASAVISHDDSARLMICSYENVLELMRSESTHFNLTKTDFQKVQSMMAWADDMPQSQSDDGLEEVNIDTLQFSTLSVIGVGETVSLAVQIVSIISVEYPPYQTIILVWDATKPKYDLNKKFITCLPQATTVKHCINLMAKLGGKLSNPYLSCILFSETLTELKQSFIRPGDYIYLTRVTICAPNTGPGVVLIGDQCRIGPLPQECPLYAELSDRITHFSRHTICVADCISNDIGTLESFHLQDYCKMLQEISSQTVTLKESYQFKVTAKVVSVHPINEKEFYDSLLLYCTCCHRFIDDDSLSRTGDVSCRRSLVPIPMITVIFEDFTGWLTGIIVGRSVMGLMKLVMIEATQPQWWTNLFATKDTSAIQVWLGHVSRLKQGWIEGKLIFRRANEGKIIPYIEDAVILDY